MLYLDTSLLVAALKVTFSPWALNRPSLSATKKPAESAAGTTATFRFGSSTLDEAAAPPPLEHPATSASASAVAVTSSALPRSRLVLIVLTLPSGEEGTLTGGTCPFTPGRAGTRPVGVPLPYPLGSIKQ